MCWGTPPTSPQLQSRELIEHYLNSGSAKEMDSMERNIDIFIWIFSFIRVYGSDMIKSLWIQLASRFSIYKCICALA